MNYIHTFILSIAILLFTACSEEKTTETTKSIENPVGTYLDSRSDVMALAKQSVQENNEKIKEQEKAMDEIK